MDGMYMEMKVKRMPVNEQVFEMMRTAIKEGRWKPGEKIPSETELSANFGVNRLTVRMAMQRLIGMGVLEARVGDGTYVKEFSFGAYIGRVSDFYLDENSMDKMFEFRFAVETSAAKLAMNQASEDELQELEEASQCFEKKKEEFLADQNEDLFQELIEADLNFHHKICEISHNELFVYAFEMIRELLYRHMEIMLKKRVAYWNAQKQKGIFWDDLHRVVYDAIRMKDIKKCQNAYEKMIDGKAVL